MKRLPRHISGLLSRIRNHDLSRHSDAELREAFTALRKQDAGANSDVLALAFAIVAEAVDRRLGAWRLFETDSGCGDLLKGIDEKDSTVIADAIAGVASQRRFRQDGDILLSAEFYRAVRTSGHADRLRFRATDEQLAAGIHLFRGKAVQMDAGEGKTVASAFPAAFHALTGCPVHLITANDYLAERDARLLAPVYRSLGISSGPLLQHMEDGERRQIYSREIVYGSMRELGFDYLRDNLKTDRNQRVRRAGQQGATVAIVDEADHALIDESFTPMIISGSPSGSSRAALRADRAVAEMTRSQHHSALQLGSELEQSDPGHRQTSRLAARLLLAEPENAALNRLLSAQPRSLKEARRIAADEHAALSEGLLYTVHPGSRFVSLTEEGRAFLEERLGPVYDSPSIQPGEKDLPSPPPAKAAGSVRRLSRRYGLANQVLQSLRARLLMQRDVDYLVDDGGVTLIDQHTGRPKPDSIYQHGLQAAVEAKEGVRVHPESETLAWISVAGFISRYRQVCGITGTATPSAGEFRRKYGLEVAVVPPAIPSLRSVLPPKMYLSRGCKTAAVIDEVAARHGMGQPVLLVSRTVEQSEDLSAELYKRGIPHRLLNAVNTASEAGIVREAGRFAAVTVSTPMAGRGTDIVPENGLNRRLVRRCLSKIRRMLEADADTVEVACPSAAEAAVLCAELEDGALPYETTSNADGVLISVKGGRGNARRRIEFALGLCVIGTEVYDSKRTEMQLYGRSGRQGEFGLTQTILSLEDREVEPEAEGFLKLRSCIRTDAAGRPFYTGQRVARLVGRLQDAIDREEEALRGYLQDYTAEFDRQTHRYYGLRQQAMESVDVAGMCRQSVERVAFRLASRHIGLDAEDYRQRFNQMADEARQNLGVDCSALYGEDLSLLPSELSALLAAKLEQRSGEVGVADFPKLARLLYLQVCGELWPGHLAGLRDLTAAQLLGGANHKSAVAQFTVKAQDAWQDFWATVETEFVSRLLTMPLTGKADETAVVVSPETEQLVAQNSPSPL